MDITSYCLIYNPISGRGNGKKEAELLCSKYDISQCIDMTEIKSYAEFFSDHKGENIIICGGDGTLNRFINDTVDLEPQNSFFYYATGSGNDFLRDIGGKNGEIINIDKYIRNLPICTVNGKDYRFINGIGFGIDGYCCEEGDKLRAQAQSDINYTGIAIKGVLFNYKTTGATVTVDGVQHKFKKAWLAPTMLGRYYGGGMMATPAQDRFDSEGKLSLMLFHGTGRIRTLMIFSGIFTGEHIKHEKSVTILTGKEITVEFNEPRALQVDGETIVGVKKYTVKSSALVKNEKVEAASV